LTSAPRLVVLTILLLVSVGCGGKAETSGVRTAGHGFVFVVNQEGWNEIWLMDAKGRQRQRLTEPKPPGTDAAGNSSARWSPDGRLIAFVGTGDSREEDENTDEIYVMDAKGDDVRRLTSNDVPDWSPDWSPDGKQIVFTRAKNTGTEDAEAGLYLMNADGSNQHLLSAGKPGSRLWLTEPAWSPDGTKIAFARASYERSRPSVDLYVMKSDGTGARRVAERALGADWSPDSRMLALTSYADRFGETCFHECGPSGEIYVTAVDGGKPRRLTTSEASDTSPTWSPDGKRIAFVSDRSDRDGHEYEIYVVGSEGGDPVRITNNTVWDQTPDWRD